MTHYETCMNTLAQLQYYRDTIVSQVGDDSISWDIKIFSKTKLISDIVSVLGTFVISINIPDANTITLSVSPISADGSYLESNKATIVHPYRLPYVLDILLNSYIGGMPVQSVQDFIGAQNETCYYS